MSDNSSSFGGGYVAGVSGKSVNSGLPDDFGMIPEDSGENILSEDPSMGIFDHSTVPATTDGLAGDDLYNRVRYPIALNGTAPISISQSGMQFESPNVSSNNMLVNNHIDSSNNILPPPDLHNGLSLITAVRKILSSDHEELHHHGRDLRPDSKISTPKANKGGLIAPGSARAAHY
jgi:hypothetical protein